MSMIELSDDVQRVIERQVAEGRATSPAAFLEEAVMRLVDEAAAEEEEIRRVVEAGTADIAAGRFTTVATPEDEERLRDGMMERLRSRFAAGG